MESAFAIRRASVTESSAVSVEWPLLITGSASAVYPVVTGQCACHCVVFILWSLVSVHVIVLCLSCGHWLVCMSLCCVYPVVTGQCACHCVVFILWSLVSVHVIVLCLSCGHWLVCMSLCCVYPVVTG